MRTKVILSTVIDIDEETISDFMLMNEVGHDEAEQLAISSERDYLYEIIDKVINNLNYPILLCGTVGTWRGRFNGYKLCNNSSDMERVIYNNYYDIEIVSEGKHYTFELHHHDGTNSMAIMELSSKGKRVDYPDPEKMYQWKYVHNIDFSL